MTPWPTPTKVGPSCTRDGREALEHFRESLRLDPTSGYAKAGIVEALKARNFVYRWLLAYFLWMMRLSNRASLGRDHRRLFRRRLLNRLADQNPNLAPWIMPIIVVYIAFVLLTWFGAPCSICSCD